MDESTDLARVKAGFILKGTTFKAWCRGIGVDPGYAHKIVAGKHNGPKARQIRQLALNASLKEVA
jgi:hypothetical protein